jgi:hypothetical protein
MAACRTGGIRGPGGRVPGVTRTRGGPITLLRCSNPTPAMVTRSSAAPPPMG